ncbi:tetratricopeptide repeat protein [Fulvivirga lutea]|uniref:Tetratricopeptide repeat protein n=1 Tax=Fulvivirga lutea TaxID=2810512 RepID=A0A974WGN4_9BACT|nr:tetratricopeptide repeat protein [Fulvivirga lutea]QSE96752.1 tetratricopeptide repeat protein [Fulvivirga lutea]
MNSDRLNQLLTYYKEDSNDPFIIYGIAMEYWKSDLENSRKYFELLLQEHPEYLATYYQVGHLYEEIDETELAKDTYRKGIKLAQLQNNQNTLRELKNALDEIEFFE